MEATEHEAIYDELITALDRAVEIAVVADREDHVVELAERCRRAADLSGELVKLF